MSAVTSTIATPPLVATRADSVRIEPTTDVTFLPSEDVLLLSVPLPAMSAAQRRTAIAFAVEDDLTQPLDQVHVVLGPQMSDGRWLVAVVSRQVLERTILPQGQRLLPDALSVPVPDVGWAVLGQPGRVVVRLSDGIGFAADPTGVVAMWQMVGSPPVRSHGGPLPAGLTIADLAAIPSGTDPSLARFDLMHGMQSGRAFTFPRRVALALKVLAVFVVGHLLIAGADMIALTRIADVRQAQVRDLLAATGQPAGDDLAVSLSQALADRGSPNSAGFLDLATHVFAAMADQTGQVVVGDLRYGAAQDAIVMTLEATDLEALQQTESNLLAAGLSVQAGAATTRDGAAEVQMTIGRGTP